ncbi:carbon-nitrogen hydrolase family protein [Streptomyces kunmingensis]|uniref:Carbon-nitrogen hydrolase family protein n=1 Tax=Streptomyces kunmingensis TaxID=68225 RepID=A0ABU6C5I3_9ACTN|nr:carbon-nitrogen hydrolase family protein [Streptomyces kunmingensis]MEB3959973.1 carbon-nitrogen hydrolase family protein [Streptomyces kunmingensis]
MSRPLPVGLVQAAARHHSAPDLDSFATEVAALTRTYPGVRLFAYPELHLCGHTRDEDAEEVMTAAAQPLGGPRGTALAALARDLGIWLVPGSVYEQGEDGRIYNTAVVYSPQGTRVAAYRKVFPWRPHETTASGTHFVVFDMEDHGRVGLSICYDAWFPEVTRHLAWQGADLVLNLVRTPTVDRAQELVLARANAIVNQVFMASVNAAPPDGIGRSVLVDPEGRVLAEAGPEPELVLTEVLDLARARSVRAHGTAGLTRVWDPFTPGQAPLELPLYEGRIDPARWREGLGGADPR